MILSCQNIKKSFGEKEILKDINFLVNHNEKCGLLGVNGAGKTTLFKILINEEKPDSGSVNKSKNCTIGYLSQITNLIDDNDVYTEVLMIFKHLIELENKISQLEEEISKTNKYELENKLKLYDKSQTEFHNLGGYEYKSKVKSVIKGLGFIENDFTRKINTLSGGEKTRLSLAKTLLNYPDLLLLDEPTNHLDINSIEWLENFLKNYNKSIILISHDRYFLDKVVNKIIEIEYGKSTVYTTNYSNYLKEKEKNKSLYIKHYEEQQKIIKKQEESIKLLKSFNREKSIKRAESKEKLLSKLERIEKPLNNIPTINLNFKYMKESGKNVLEVNSVYKSYKKQLFNNLNFQIIKGEKIALLGDNGVGKTTLLKIILGYEKPDSGSIKIGSEVLISYYDQEHNNLNYENTIFEEVRNEYVDISDFEIRSVLATFLFKENDINKKIKDLSGGEKSRVSFTKMMLSKSNLLLLDEPTNHLDLPSKEILEKAINNYTGTVMYISHDRYFINNTADKIINIEDKTIKIFLGNYDYYINKKATMSNNTPTKILEEDSINKVEWIENKTINSNKRKIKNKIISLENDIEALETSINKIDEYMLTPEISTDNKKLENLYNERLILKHTLNLKYTEWENIQLNKE